jgi:hypothetical protein
LNAKWAVQCTGAPRPQKKNQHLNQENIGIAPRVKQDRLCLITGDTGEPKILREGRIFPEGIVEIGNRALLDLDGESAAGHGGVANLTSATMVNMIHFISTTTGSPTISDHK